MAPERSSSWVGPCSRVLGVSLLGLWVGVWVGEGIYFWGCALTSVGPRALAKPIGSNRSQGSSGSSGTVCMQGAAALVLVVMGLGSLSTATTRRTLCTWWSAGHVSGTQQILVV